MNINTNEKITKQIFERISDYKLIAQKDISNLDELSIVLSNPSITSSDIMNHINKIDNISSQEYSFDNELKYMISNITYLDQKGNKRSIIEHIIYNKTEENPELVISTKKENLSINQLLISTVTQDDLIPDSDKNIEITTTAIYTKNIGCIEHKSYRNNINNTILMEKYIKHKTILNKKISKSIEYMYQDGKQVSSYTSNPFSIELNELDNYSVDFLIEEINKIFNGIEKNKILKKQ